MTTETRFPQYKTSIYPIREAELDRWEVSFPEMQAKIAQGALEHTLWKTILGLLSQAREPLLYRVQGQETLYLGLFVDSLSVLGYFKKDAFPTSTSIAKIAFPIANAEGLREIALIEAVYDLKLGVEIREFLFHYAGIRTVLGEAATHLEKHFGGSYRLRLTLERDPEAANYEQMVAYILTDLSVAQALEALDRFDSDWFLDQLDRLDGNFNFNVDFV